MYRRSNGHNCGSQHQYADDDSIYQSIENQLQYDGSKAETTPDSDSNRQAV